VEYGIRVRKIDSASRSYDKSVRVEHLIFLEKLRVLRLKRQSSFRLNWFQPNDNIGKALFPNVRALSNEGNLDFAAYVRTPGWLAN
jgi:hypothetical protein